jgi:putative endonuclease
MVCYTWLFEQDNKSTVQMNDIYWVYILYCENDSFYTGYTNNLIKRYREHVSGSAKCKYTRSFKPRYVAQCWPIFSGKSVAMRLERQIKNLTHAQKKCLVKQPASVTTLIDLSFT